MNVVELENEIKQAKINLEKAKLVLSMLKNAKTVDIDLVRQAKEVVKIYEARIKLLKKALKNVKRK